MRKLFALLTVISLAATAISQDITLRFTGTKSDNSYIRLDSVQVQNITRSWSETVLYPDTVLAFAQTGIAVAQNRAADIASYPNPFNGATNVSVALPQSCEAIMQVYNLAGQKVAERTMLLEAGNNLFELHLQNPQVYLLAVTTPQGRSTIKLLNRGEGSENSISYRGNSNFVEKRQSANPFQSGDMLKITGYATFGGSAAVSNVIQQSQTGSENFTMIFPVLSQRPPTVNTTAASNITDTSAVSGGNVTSDGGAAVTARGVCWSTSHNPTISDTHTSDGTGTGTFTSNISGLTPGTTYYVRAYATNSVGTAYGNEITVAALANLPIVSTTAASNISDTSAISGGNVTSDGGAAVTARGVCWDTSHNPTINGSHSSDGTGTGTFTSNISGLTPGTTYYVRAYATNSAGTAYGNEDTITTRYILHGTIQGVFSVSASNRVYFSPGNLQWSATGGGSVATTHTVVGGTGEGTWRFAPNQWDTIGAANRNLSSSYAGWADLFGWATAGWHYPSDIYNTNYKPYSRTVSPVDQNYNYYGYGPSSNMPPSNLVGANANYDWGVYNSIYNPKTLTTDVPGIWRTPTKDEWVYLLFNRNTVSGQLFAKATVNGVPGLIILPDNWISAIHTFDSTNDDGASYAANIISSVLWDTLENAGAAFLPAAGTRTRSGFETSSGYWSTTFYFQSQSHYLYLNANGVNPYSGGVVYEGRSVRLVRDTATATLPTVTIDTFRNITDTSAYCDSRVTNNGGAIVYARGVCWSTSHNPTISDSHTLVGYGTGSFVNNITGLNRGTTYYVRAYASNAAGTAYSNEDTITVSAVPSGALRGVFTVASGKGVFFSKGNLQWSAKNGGSSATTHATADGTAAGTWRFATNQWDTIGAANNSISSSNRGWIDLFGWGTSGWNNGNYFYQPYSSSNSTASPYTSSIGYGYGPTDGSAYNNPLTGIYANADWGVYNAISNGGNAPGKWRTLTYAEWTYLLNTRYTPSRIRYAKATVNGVCGLIIVPDNWRTIIYTLNSTNTTDAAYTSNVISAAQWTTLENVGCVFLPATGTRAGTTINGVGSAGSYWASMRNNTNNAYNAKFTNAAVTPGNTNTRYIGCAVRLVADTAVAVPPTVTTTVASNITDTSAVSGGNVTSDGGAVVYARGVCWDTLPNPTINNSHTINASDTGSFTSSITGLTTRTTYYVRAYATNYAGTTYGNEDTITTAGSHTFSVSADDSVIFSPGNLQWSANNGGSTATTHTVAGGGTAAGTWRFAPNQWDTIGSGNTNISSSYSGWIDLFGWGTSGYNQKYPYMTSTTSSDYGDGDTNISNTNYDWGVYNAIYNPKTSTTDAPGTWRTLTKDEWVYLFDNRRTASGIRYARATVNGVPGLIIVPDNWSNSTYALNSTNIYNAAYTSNVINLATWTTLENAGCVFLPTSGSRFYTLVYEVSESGYYWSATYYDSSDTYILYFRLGTNPSYNGSRYNGKSVRLVRDF